MKNKRIPALVLLGAAVTGLLGGTAGAAEADAAIQLRLNDTAALKNGQPVILETPPELKGDTTMVPLRFVSESLGAAVEWDGTARTITLKQDGRNIRLTIDRPEAEVDGQPAALEQPAFIRSGTTLVPLRFVAEQLHQDVAYDAATKTITLTPAAGQGTPPALPPEKKPTYPPPRDTPAAEPVQQKLETPTVDDLTRPSNVGNMASKYYFPPVMLSSVSDKRDHVYLLQNDREGSGVTGYGSFRILQYDKRVAGPDLSYGQVFDHRYNFSYKDQYGNTRPFDYSSFAPAQLHYNEQTGGLYVMGESIDPEYQRILIYQVLPEVKLITSSPNKGVNFLTNPNFLATTDGVRFYYSDVYHGTIYTAQAGQESVALDSIPSGASNGMLSVVQDGQVFVIDKGDQSIYKVTNKGLELHKKLELEKVKGMSASRGFFYAADEERIYQINPTNGEKSVYTALQGLMYSGAGYYNPAEEQGDRAYQAGRLTVDSSNPFTVDEAGNVFLFDSLYQKLRRINVYP
ncbi:copper amine oxidase N-terminal domain-containing protein [Paenibacillus caseinilyticus]|uniref:Copper amine oxidase n=1 Tax=Paenibacillus mucilaginosus K02 TaxID=997761 RepID=I0BBW6_9BACL|nr:copper amine oxidase N-terminal domain-containing protein [Paenibacillus mucilaginosus]AFH59863.1 copper amine oxidase [Paenibacillus mucilaginosus K02]AFK65365.1 copper amine oxidase domain-containing protein [Paenibacillus mucilaginosus K02]